MRAPDRYEDLGNGKHRAWFGTRHADVTLSRERDYAGLMWDRIHLPLYEMASNVLPVGSNVFEAGCGSGYGSHCLTNYGHRVTACDVSDEALRFARLTKDTFETPPHFIPLDLNRGIIVQLGPFVPAFDAVVAIESIEHIERDAFAMSEFFRVTESGGHLFITTPEARKDRAPSPFHIREYSKDEFRDLVEGAGYVIKEWLGHKHFPDTMIIHAIKPER